MNEDTLIDLGEISEETKGGRQGEIEFVEQPKLDD